MPFLQFEKTAAQPSGPAAAAVPAPRTLDVPPITIDRFVRLDDHARAGRIAVEHDGRCATYGEMEAMSNRLARALRERGIGRGDRVGLHVRRGIELLALQFAVLKTGAAYVPLDPAFPSARLAFMARDARLALLVSETELFGAFAWPADRTFLWDRESERTAARPAGPLPPDVRSAGAADPAYVIYTSGSTGVPKGVVIPHAAVVNFLESMSAEPGLGPDDVFVAVTTVSFDIAVLEFLLPLAVGARVVLATPEPVPLKRILERSGATAMQGTPSTWSALLDAGWTGSSSLKALVGGEALPPTLAARLLARVRELWNMYGPTETTVWSTCCRIESAEPPLSIGRPIARTHVRIVDAQLRSRPPGEVGEICIGGAGVALGYHERPDIERERFVLLPGDPGAGRMYRTGDLGRWRADGSLEFLGRIDHQIKIRGYRIEPAEVESCLAADPAVRECVVVAREDRPGDVRLVAYVARGAGALDPAALRSRATRDLPRYMVPQHIVVLDALPRLPNGKTDRGALPPPVPARAAVPDTAGSPWTDAERKLAGIFADALGIESLRVTDNFFDLGGHSLTAMNAAQRIEQAFGYAIDPRRLVNETLGQLAASLENPTARRCA